MSQIYDVAIIGAGSSGICAAIQLKKIGLENFIILEKGDDVGGTWFWNRYPGAECDVQSHLYSFSFEPNPSWTQPFAGQQEILTYLKHCAEKYELSKHLKFRCLVTDCNWSDEMAYWQLISGEDERITAKIVISALGMFNKIVWPKIEGINQFKGDLFHSARWDHDVSLKNKNVGVVGIAASAVQFAPEICNEVNTLSLYQRTANWVVPKPNVPYTKAELASLSDEKNLRQSRNKVFEQWDSLCTFQDKSIMAEIERSGLERIAEVEDPIVRRQLTPNHPFGCKRPLFSDKFYPIFNRKNVELICDPIKSVTDNSIETEKGTKKHDVLIFSTGFETTTYLNAINVSGRNGVNLRDAWDDGPQAYLGITTSGFPNLFMLYGPNTNQGCILYMIEKQVEYTIRQITRIRKQGLRWIDLDPTVQKQFNEKIQQEISQVDVWQASCGNDFYYRAGNSGRLVTQWPNSMTAYDKAIGGSDEGIYLSDA